MSPHTKMLVGIIAGASLGLIAPYLLPVQRVVVDLAQGVVVVKEGFAVDYELIATYLAEPVGQIFLRLLWMMAVPLIFSALVVGVSELDMRSLGKVGLRTLGYTVAVSSVAVAIGLTLVNVIEPGGGDNTALRELAYEQAQHRDVPKPPAKSGVGQFVSMIPDNPIGAAASGDMLGLIVFGLTLGIGLSLVRTGPASRLREVLVGLNDVSMRLIEGVMRLAPFGVAGLLFASVSRLGFDVLGKIAIYVAVVVGALLIHMIVAYGLFLYFGARRNPWQFLRGSRLALQTAFATSSSSATLPTSLKVAERDLNLPGHISRFVLTAGASMNQNGTALFEGVTVLFMAQLFAVDLTLAQQASVMMICILGGVGTAGVPGASLPVIAMMMAMYGIPPAGLALILGVDRFLDMCRTTVNVAGDLVVAACVAEGESGLPLPDAEVVERERGE